jgi:hypothetical protein
LKSFRIKNKGLSVKVHRTTKKKIDFKETHQYFSALLLKEALQIEKDPFQLDQPLGKKYNEL